MKNNQGNGIYKPRKVKCIETGEVFESIAAAARSLGDLSVETAQSGIRRCIEGRYNVCMGYHWVEVKEGEIEMQKESATQTITEQNIYNLPSRAVLKINLKNGEAAERYESVGAACRKTGLSDKVLRRIAKNHIPVDGYVFSYEDEYSYGTFRNGSNETMFEHTEYQEKFTITTAEKLFASKINELQKKYPEDVEISYRDSKGGVVAKIPLEWVKIVPSKKKELDEDGMKCLTVE